MNLGAGVEHVLGYSSAEFHIWLVGI